MTWTHSAVLWALALLPIVGISALFARRRNRWNPEFYGKKSVEGDVRAFLRDSFFIGFLCFAILAAANPHRGRKPLAGEGSGLDIAVAFDVSRSMLAEDLNPSRLGRAAAALRQLLQTMDGARFSLIPFKGKAITLAPMTEDRVALEMMVEGLGSGLLTIAGTDIEAALQAARQSFPGDQGRRRIIVLISDGEALSGRVSRISRELAEEGLPVHVLAAGSAEGAVIPLPDGQTVKDASGKPVVSRTDSAALGELADETGGSFHNLSPPGAMGEMISLIEERQGFEGSAQFIGVNQYRAFLIPALIFLLLQLVSRVIPWPRS